MVEFVVTGAAIAIPVAVAATVLTAVTVKAPGLYRVTTDLPKATWEALARNATVDIPMRAVASRNVDGDIIPQGRWRTSSRWPSSDPSPPQSVRALQLERLLFVFGSH
jgi:hypothetical protein